MAVDARCMVTTRIRRGLGRRRAEAPQTLSAIPRSGVGFMDKLTAKPGDTAH
jgi:hypothetical protein